MDYFSWIADERRGLADLLDTLSPAQLAAQSLCGEWTVQEVCGHLVLPMTVSTPRMLLGILRAGGRFDVANARLSRKAAAAGPARLAQTLRDRATNRFVPPGGTSLNPLADVVIHGQDIRRPLGLDHTLDAERLTVILDFLVSPAGTRGVVRKGALEGLRLEAADLDWAGGDGALVRGPGEAVMMALAGRTPALADLDGDGVSTLATRVS